MKKGLMQLNLLLLILFAVSCAKTNKKTKSDLNLQNTKWVIASVKDLSNNSDTKLNGSYTLSFDDKNATVSLSANSCTFEGLTFSNDKIKVTPNASFCTERCCDNEESKLIKDILAADKQCKLQGNILVLFDKNKEYQLNAFKEDPEIAVNVEDLLNSSWQLYDVADQVSGLASRLSETILIAFEKGRFSVKLKVNTCKTSFTESNNVITFPEGPMGCTKMCCDSKEGKEFLTYFQGDYTLTKKDGMLYFKNDSRTLRFEIVQK